LGGLTVYPNEPSPWYEFEMLKKDMSGRGGSPSLFLHYKARQLPHHLVKLVRVPTNSVAVDS